MIGLRWLLVSLFLIVSCCGVSVSVLAAGIAPWNKECLADQREWKKRPGHKAVAVTKIYGNGQGCGHSWDAPTQAEANKIALRKCTRALRKHLPKSKDVCTIIESQ
jgi:hypothetical protein